MKNRGDILLQKWIAGSITYAEEQELERLAQADPFLADAWAGLRQMPEADHGERVARIKERLRARQARKGGGLLFYLPRIAAAAAVVVALMIGLRYFVWNEKPEADVAMTEQTEATETVPDIAEDSVMEPEVQSDVAKPETPESQTSNPKTGTSNPQPQIAEVQAEKEAVVPETMNEVTVLEATRDRTEDLAARMAPPPPPPPPPKPEEKAQAADRFTRSKANAAVPQRSADAAASGSRTISGTVTDESGLPLIGASILVKGTTIGTVSDIDGKFALTIPEDGEVIIVNYTGFANREIKLGQGDSLNVQMNAQQMALDEVVVTGMGKRKSDRQVRREERAAAKLPEPREGFKKLERYIRRNLRYPEAAREQGIEGPVQLKFEVLPDGSLTNFVVRESLGYGCDEEAIRLLREGPAWRIFSLENNTMVYTIYFELK